MPLAASEHLDRDFLAVRAALLDIAAALDRIDRADGAFTVRDDPRYAALARALRMLGDGEPERTQRIQTHLSDAYSPAWR